MSAYLSVCVLCIYLFMCLVTLLKKWRHTKRPLILYAGEKCFPNIFLLTNGNIADKTGNALYQQNVPFWHQHNFSARFHLLSHTAYGHCIFVIQSSCHHMYHKALICKESRLRIVSLQVIINPLNEHRYRPTLSSIKCKYLNVHNLKEIYLQFKYFHFIHKYIYHFTVLVWKFFNINPIQ